MNICPVGAELFHVERWTDRKTDGRTEGQTDTTKPIVAFRNITNVPNKNGSCCVQNYHTCSYKNCRIPLSTVSMEQRPS